MLERSDPLNRVRGKMCLAHRLVFCVRTCSNVLKRKRKDFLPKSCLWRMFVGRRKGWVRFGVVVEVGHFIGTIC